MYFNDVLFKMFKREFGKLKRKHKVIKKEENRIEKTIQSTINQFWLEQESRGNKVTNSLNTFNPLTSHLYFKISFIFFKIFISNYLSSAKSQQFFIKKKEFSMFEKVDAEFQNGAQGEKDGKTEGKVALDTANQHLQENQQLILKDNS